MEEIDKRNYTKHLLTPDEIHARELNMFQLFNDFCRENGLRCYMCGGTLLGAVRHGGFIPWDDDLDLLMPRPDYDRMQELIREQPFLPRYEFHSRDIGNLNENFTKLADLRTEVDKQYTEDEYDRHLWIDAFPMDGLPEDEKKVEDIYRKVLRSRRLLKFLKSKKGTGKTKLRARIKPMLKPVVRLFRNKEQLLNRIDRIARDCDFESSRYVGGVVYGYGPQERMVREDFVKEVPMRFETVEAAAPGCYDAYLTALYGDYMQPPPEEKKKVHFMDIYGW